MQADDLISKKLTQLTQQTVTIKSLLSTQVGATVNKLRKLEGTPLATKIVDTSQAPRRVGVGVVLYREHD